MAWDQGARGSVSSPALILKLLPATLPIRFVPWKLLFCSRTHEASGGWRYTLVCGGSRRGVCPASSLTLGPQDSDPTPWEVMAFPGTLLSRHFLEPLCVLVFPARSLFRTSSVVGGFVRQQRKRGRVRVAGQGCGRRTGDPTGHPLADCSLGPTRLRLPARVQFRWNTATPVSFRIVCGCFCLTRAESSSRKNDRLALKD